MSISPTPSTPTFMHLSNSPHFNNPPPTEAGYSAMMKAGAQALEVLTTLQQISQSNVCGLKVKRAEQGLPYSILVGHDLKGNKRMFALSHGFKIGTGVIKKAKLVFDLSASRMCCATKLSSTDSLVWPDLEAEAQREISSLKRLTETQGIAQLHIVVKTEGKNKKGEQVKRIYLVQELGAQGTLESFLRQYPETTHPLSIQIKWHIASTFLEALKNMHERGVLHRDLKLNNLVIDERFSAKIIDFGLSCPISESPEIVNIQWWMAEFVPPEILRAVTAKSPEQLIKATNTKWDCFMAGIILYQIFYGATPCVWANTFAAKVEKMLKAGPNNWIPKHLSEVTGFVCPNRLIKALLEDDPEKRFSASSAFEIASTLSLKANTPAPLPPLGEPTPNSDQPWKAGKTPTRRKTSVTVS